ncbi:hypothetical protein CBS147333_10231 [Penicillium roqueforti]|nr:hypothetical protein CBS147333_10231 [Penicillium roqueforti]KAI3187433.1 hypothetical protein CBS147311_10204 [Penicillium roqueforti]KAI3260758.1 hypothetical protein CBS147308_10220 [Penicillium roqueforti]KAI3276049.1 hypothetical protein DTO003C3_10228 [Penicillium roqueforti]
MPPKKATNASKKAAPAAHPSYREMIKDAIANLKERNGSSRQAIKKYVTSNNKVAFASQSAFDAQFNKAVKTSVEKGEFTQPKGPSGPVKLAKKDAFVKPVTKPGAKHSAKAATKSTATKKAAPKTAAKKATPKETTTKAAPKKTATKTAPKIAANRAAAKPKARKTSTMAPAIVEKAKVVTKTKSGRVTKTTAPPTPKAATNKPATKK